MGKSQPVRIKLSTQAQNTILTQLDNLSMCSLCLARFLLFKIIPTESIDSIHKLINAPISLIVNMDDNYAAKGSLFLD
jgi:hypothetical protein